MSAPRLTSLGHVPVRIHDAGPPARAAVLFFHGLRSSAETLDAEARALSAAGITAILPDAPHHGARRSAFLETMPDTATIEGYTRLLAILREARDEVPALVDHLLTAGYARVAIAGVSMGAYVALAAATIEPRLAAVASVLGSPDWTPHEGDAARDVTRFAAALAESPHLRTETWPVRPLLLVNGAHDANVRPDGARALAARLRPRFATAGTTLDHRELAVGHFPPPPLWEEMVSATVDFLARELSR